jgi:hypothetical protein
LDRDLAADQLGEGRPQHAEKYGTRAGVRAVGHDLTGCRHGAAGYARRVVTETDLELRDGRTLHVYDALADGADAGLTVFWHHT